MRLLFLAPHQVYPPRHGTGSRIFHLARELRRKHEVTVVCFDEAPPSPAASPPPFETVTFPWTGVPRSRLRRWGSRLGPLVRSAASPANLDALRALIRSKGIDAVIVENLQLAHLLPALRDLPMAWVEEGILSDLHHPSAKPRRSPYRRLQDRIEHLAWRRLEHWAWRQASVVIAVSEAEAAQVRQRLGSAPPVVVVPNGVDTTHFAPSPIDGRPPQAIFVGSRWHPNVEALNFLVNEILPRVRAEISECRLAVAGEVCGSRELRLLSAEGVSLLGFVDDLRPLYASSRTFVAPILRGHGTRIKILEAMAAGVPVISTTKGAEGLEVEGGRHLLLADSAEEFAAGMARLMRDPELAGRLAVAARKRVEERYDWRQVAQRFEEALSEIRDPASETPAMPVRRGTP